MTFRAEKSALFSLPIVCYTNRKPQRMWTVWQIKINGV